MKSAKIIESDGWIQRHQKGSHCQFKHPSKKGRVTVPHLRTVISIFKQADINKEDIK